MSNYIIETKHLTKQYGTQKSVADLNIHGKRKDLWSAGKKRGRKDHDYENAAWSDAAHFRRGKNLGETFAGERKEIAPPHWQSD